MTYFVVLRRSGPEWDSTLPTEEQAGWDEHAANPWTIRLDGRKG